MTPETIERLPDGREARTYVLGETAGIALHVSELGATVRELWVPDRDGARRNVVLGLDGAAAYLGSRFFEGATIGRYANRIAGGRFTLDGVEHVLPANEPPHHLHGGPDGFHRRLWRTVRASGDSLQLALTSPDGDQGYPGTLEVSVTYAVRGGEVRIEYAAVADAPTPVNLTNHSYFNLAGAGATIDDQVLQVLASGYTPVGPDLIPLAEPRGGAAPVEGTSYDLRAPRVLREVSLDHNLVVDGTGLRTHAVLATPDDALGMTLLSDQPGLQVYTGDGLDRRRAGLALEPQRFPDSPNRPDYPSPVLRPGERYSATIVWRFRS